MKDEISEEVCEYEGIQEWIAAVTILKTSAFETAIKCWKILYWMLLSSVNLCIAASVLRKTHCKSSTLDATIHSRTQCTIFYWSTLFKG